MEWVVNSMHRSLTQKNDPDTQRTEAGWAPEPVGPFGQKKNISVAGVRALDRPARSLAFKPTNQSQLLFETNVKINVPMHENEGVRGSGGITRLIPHRGTILRRDLSFTFRWLHPREKNHRYPLNRRLGGPRETSFTPGRYLVGTVVTIPTALRRLRT
jgi:hypothetical protein